MPKLLKEFPIVLGFRTTEADAQKLADLARKTCRGQGDVLRLLLRQAVLSDAPDIRLEETFLTSAGGADDARTYNGSCDAVGAERA
jgi:hypothetical protein